MAFLYVISYSHSERQTGKLITKSKTMIIVNFRMFHTKKIGFQLKRNISLSNITLCLISLIKYNYVFL